MRGYAVKVAAALDVPTFSDDWRRTELLILAEAQDRGLDLEQAVRGAVAERGGPAAGDALRDLARLGLPPEFFAGVA